MVCGIVGIDYNSVYHFAILKRNEKAYVRARVGVLVACMSVYV